MRLRQDWLMSRHWPILCGLGRKTATRSMCGGQIRSRASRSSTTRRRQRRSTRHWVRPGTRRSSTTLSRSTASRGTSLPSRRQSSSRSSTTIPSYVYVSLCLSVCLTVDIVSNKSALLSLSATLHFIVCIYCAFSALTVLVGRQEEHPACNNWVMRCWCGYLSAAARCKLFAYGPADATASQYLTISCLI